MADLGCELVGLVFAVLVTLLPIDRHIVRSRWTLDRTDEYVLTGAVDDRTRSGGMDYPSSHAWTTAISNETLRESGSTLCYWGSWDLSLKL